MTAHVERVQAATAAPADLTLWAHGDLQADLRAGATSDEILYFFGGLGTSSYEHPPSVASLVAKYPSPDGSPYVHVTLAGWSAGGRGVEHWLAEMTAAGRVPDAVLLADALYAALVRGKANTAQLAAVIAYAKLAAASDTGPVFVFWHSAIVPPGYASSGQCAAAIRTAVEAGVGPMDTFEAPVGLARPTLTSAVKRGRCYLLGYSGQTAGEHVAEAHLVDDALRAYVPWASDACSVVDGKMVCVDVTAAPAGDTPAEPVAAPVVASPEPTEETAAPTLSSPVAAPVEAEAATLQPGDRGDAVAAWQTRLTAAGYDCGKIDGWYGTRTANETRAFQLDHHVGADGCADKSTMKAMDKAESERATALITLSTAAPLESIGLRALVVALAEVGVHEVVGKANNPRILEYLRGARRGGALLKLGDEDIAWCAAFACWCEQQAANLTEQRLPWVASVYEIWADAVTRGTARARIYLPQPGDLMILGRDGQDPRTGGHGHVTRVVTKADDAGLVWCVGGNEGGTLHSGGEVLRTQRKLSDPGILGYVVRS